MDSKVTLALNYALKKGFQIHPDAFELLEGVAPARVGEVIKQLVREKGGQNRCLIGRDDLESLLGIKEDPDLKGDYTVLSDPTPKITTAEGVEGYNALFASRFAKLKKTVAGRPEAKLIKSIASLAVKTKEDIHVCGLVVKKSAERNLTKITIDDPTGTVDMVVFGDDLRKAADTLLDDQFVMVRASTGERGGYVVRDIIMPDVPEHRPNRSESEAYAAFISDLHVGSRYFMEDEFEEFVSWLSSPDPVAMRIRFVAICGDLVDGVGIYKNQDKELIEQTLEEQLQRAYEILEKIPKHIKVFIVPGNHDPGRRALPQPAIPKKYCPALWERENFVMLGNPATVSFNGVKVTMFHGQSIDDAVKTTPGLSYGKPADVMKHLLRARHMGPIFGSQTPIAPELEDMLVIDEIPDIFHVGHVHIMGLDMYRNVLLVNAGAWQGQTPFQASVGQIPTPGLAVVINLKSFEVYYKDFNSEDVL